MDEFLTDRDPFEVIAASFLARQRAGDPPSIEEYAARFPAHASEIRKHFPVLMLKLVENVEPVTDDVTGIVAGSTSTGAGTSLRRLGDFRLVREIGRGGMGVVYEAEQESLGRHVALKVLQTGQFHDQGQMIRFDREARAAARLHHTNIVPVFGVGECDGVHFYVMQYIPGLALDAVLEEVRKLGVSRRKTINGSRVAPSTSGMAAVTVTAADLAQSLGDGRFEVETSRPAEPIVSSVVDSEKREGHSGSAVALPGQADLTSDNDSARSYARSVARIGLQVADAVAYAHQQGVLHRDIKPANLLLDAHGTVWVTDFGLAKIASDSDLTRTGDVVGTIRYMAPERFQGICDARADIYALGLTLYEFLARRPAFAAGDRHALIRQVTHEEPRGLRQIDRRIPRDLETIVHKAIAKDPKDRYATAAELRDELGRFLDDRPIRARQISYTERLARWGRRNPGLARLSTALLLAVMSGTILSWVLTIRANREADRANGEATRANDQTTRALAAESKARLAETAAVTEAQRIRRLLYDSDMNVAAELWESGDGSPRAIEDLLAGHQSSAGQEDFRELSWRFQWNLLHNSSIPFRGHKGFLLARLTPDGRLLTFDGGVTLRHWDRDARSVGRSMKLSSSPDLIAAAFSRNGRFIALASRSGPASVFDTTTGQQVRILKANAPFFSLAFAPDGKRLVSIGEDSRAIVWDVATGREMATIALQMTQDKIQQSVLAPDGKTLLMAGHPYQSNVAVYEAGVKGPKHTFLDIGNTIESVACSPDGRTAAWGDENGRVFLFDIVTGQTTGEPLSAHASGLLQLAFSSDGSLLASGGTDSKVVIWDVVRRQPVLHLKGHTERVTSLSFSEDGKLLVSGSQDGSARIWELSSYGKPRILATSGDSNVMDVAFSADGLWIATGDSVPRIWNARTGRLVRTLASNRGWDAYRVAFSQDSSILATGGLDSRVTLWDVVTGRVLQSLDGRASETSISDRDRMIGAVSFSRDGKLVAAGFGDPNWLSRSQAAQFIKIWEVGTGRLVRVLDVTNFVRKLEFSPDGKQLAVACLDNGVRVWETTTWSVAVWADAAEFSSRQDEAATGAYCVAFSSAGNLLAAGFYNGRILIWDTAKGGLIRRANGRHLGLIRNVAFSPDGRTLISAGHDKTIKLWDVQSGRELRTLRGHDAGLTSLALSPDGDLIATGAEDGTVRLWEAVSPLEIAVAGSDAAAIEEIQGRAARAHPGDLRHWTRLALAYARHGQPDRAGASLLTALDLATAEHPDQPIDPAAFALEVSTWISLLPAAIRDRVASAVSQKPDAVLQAAMSARRDDPRVWLARSRALSMLGQQSQAEADLERAFKLTPESSSDWLLWMEAGRCFAEHDQTVMAEIAFAKADALNCENPEVLLVWGRQFAEEGQWSRAALIFGRFPKLLPGDSFMARCWVNTLRQAGELTEYRRACTQLLDRYGETQYPLVTWELVMALVHSPDTGITDWTRLIRLGQKAVTTEPTNPWLRHALAGAYLRAGQYHQAFRCLDESDRLAGVWHARVLNDLMRAIVKLRLGNTLEARQLLNQADKWYERHLKPAPGKPFGEWTNIVWFDWLSFQFLRREAESLLAKSYQDLPADVFTDPAKQR